MNKTDKLFDGYLGYEIEDSENNRTESSGRLMSGSDFIKFLELINESNIDINDNKAIIELAEKNNLLH